MTPALILAALLQSSSAQADLTAWRDGWSPEQSACVQGLDGLDLPARAGPARDILWARRAELPSYCLMEAASLWAGDDNTRAAELYALGRVRYRYDKARCVDPKGRNSYDAFHWSLTVAYAQIVQAGLEVGAPPEPSRTTMARLAADPATFPTDEPDPQVCEDPSGGLAPKAKWAAAAQALREQMTAP